MQWRVATALVFLAACGGAGTGVRDAAVGDAALGDAGRADDGATDAGDAGLDADLRTVPEVWRPQVIYLAIPDRFFDGDPANNRSGTPGCFDPTNAKASHGGDLAGLRQKRAYLADLGITALWVLPLYKQSPDRCGYHGYWADFADPDDGAIEPTMGSAAELTALIDELHAVGIRFILDMVENHAGRGARVVTQQPGFFHDPATCATLGDPAVFCPIGGLPLPDFAVEKPAVASYLEGISLGWASRFAIDGIRMDTVKNVQVSFWRDAWLPAMKAAHPALFTVGEVFDEGAASNLKPYLDAGFDSLFDYPRYRSLLDAFAAGGSVDPLAARIKEEIAAWGYPRTLMMTSFLDNHDNLRFTSAVPAGLAEDEIRARYHLALGALFTLPGIPELYYGDELGLYGKADPDNRRDMPAWAWSAADRAGAHPGLALPDSQRTFAWVQRLIALRKHEPALQTGSYTELWHQGGGTANLFAFLRGGRVLVAIDNGAATGAVHVPVQGMLPDGTVLDDLAAAGAPATLTVSGGAVTIDLPARTLGIYRVR